jgi:hypothetical protein
LPAALLSSLLPFNAAMLTGGRRAFNRTKA